MKKSFFNIKNSKMVGFYLLFIGIVALAKILFLHEFKIIYVILILIMIPSVDFIIRGSAKKRYRGFLIPGITFLLTSLFLFFYLVFIDKNVFGISKIWPIFGIFPAISLVTYYITTPQKEPKIIIPAIFLFLLSVIFLFYTYGVITFKFKFILLLLIPLFIVFVGLYFIFNKEIKFFKKQRDSNNIKKKGNK